VDDVIASARRFGASAAALGDAQLCAPSALPGWTRGHVLTHVARAADSRRGLLEAARRGAVGRQYDSEQQRADDIEEGARRSPTVIREDVTAALERLLAAVTDHPADRWEQPGEFLGVGLRPVRRVVPSMLRELELHHVDLDAGYRPRDWPPDFVAEQLERVTVSLAGRAEPFTVRLPDRTLAVGDGGRMTVAGDPAPMLAWLTGRGTGTGLHVDPPDALPQLPPLS
jgi:maleylpyruvate isomerase